MPTWTLPLVLLLGAPPEAPDFKLRVELRGADKEAVSTAQIVVRHGTAYQFIAQFRDEVQVIDLARRSVTLIHLKQRVQTEIGPAHLSSSVDRLRQSIEKAVVGREATGERADKLAAAMGRDLVGSNLETRYDAATHRLRMTNPSVEIDARGEPEPDSGRLAAIETCLSTLARMSAVRDPAGLPPFPFLETLRALVTERHLRPTEISVLYRLAGPPRRLRWTYQVVPELTDDEREAISRIDSLRSTARFVRYPGYAQTPP